MFQAGLLNVFYLSVPALVLSHGWTITTKIHNFIFKMHSQFSFAVGFCRQIVMLFWIVLLFSINKVPCYILLL